MSRLINITDYAAYKINDDWGGAIFEALQSCKEGEETILSFPTDCYQIYESRCLEKYLFISNHDHSLKRIAFALQHNTSVTIEGNGSEFMFHGRVLPFAVEHSSQITLRNMIIDYKRPFFSQGEVLEASHEHIVLRIDPELYPFYVDPQNMIHFYSPDEWDSTYVKWLVEFDPQRGAPAYGFGDSNIRSEQVYAEQLAPDIVKIVARLPQVHTPGHIVGITHEHRYNPGLFINDSSEVLIENVTFHHAGAMAIIGQNSKDITLRGVQVGVRPGSGRVISANNDASHFVNCEGTITLDGCTFLHQLDDGANIHGIYTQVARVYSSTVMEVELMHFQQQGVNVYRAGDEIAFVNPMSWTTRHTATIRKATSVNSRFLRLELEQEVLSSVCIGESIENITRMPEVVIRNCRIGDNRARGMLISTHKRTIIEDNVFHTSGTSVACGGEMDKWFESGLIRDVTIRNNQFINCGYGRWGEGTIRVSPNAPALEKDQPLHSGLKVMDNDFYTFKRTVVDALSVSGLVFTGNTIRRSNDFQPFGASQACVLLKQCEACTVEDNQIEGYEDGSFIMVSEQQ